ncbi:OmpA family protein [Microbulbifer sp. TYP-18]|uniref:OmpA family protein n=1 Tax=Microbulbifer sp. TYP-18 TaxID=3230024 RepID=UPI0034C6415A
MTRFVPLAILILAGTLFLGGCYDPHKKYVYPLTPREKVADSAGEKAARRAAPLGDALVRYLRNGSGVQDGEFTLGVRFRAGGSAPRMDTLRDLEALLVIMRDYPSLRIAIEAHTDSEGEADKNLKLSQWRADWVGRFLIERGIDAERIEAQGFGASLPIADDSTPEGQRLNRRLVIRVLNFDRQPLKPKLR